MTDAFVYERQRQEATFASIPVPVHQRPIIHTSGSRNGSTTFQSPKDSKDTSGNKEVDGKETEPGTTSATVGASAPTAEQRRFHMSRADIMLASSNYPTHRSYRGISKKRSAPALFVERKHKRAPSSKLQSVARGLDIQTPGVVPDVPSTPHESEEMEVDVAEIKQRKKPGLARQVQKAAPTKKAELPDSMVNRWNVDLDQLTADMNAFAMQQIGLNLQRQEEEEKKQRERAAAQRSRMMLQSSPSRFKPKAPAKRYAERHRENPETAVEKGALNPNVGTSDTDEEDYVIETYVRVPASAMNKQQVAAKDVGLLVFDEEPDMELFYGTNDDSDDEWAEDDEDENGKIHGHYHGAHLLRACS